MNSITVNTPIGNYIVEESEGFITSVRRGEVRVGGNTTPLLLKAKNQLKEYFAGKRKKFDLPLKPEGTDFQKQVWLALESIPFGETASYLDIANGIKNYRTNNNSFILITHYYRILKYLNPDFVHVLLNGEIVKSGDIKLALKLEKEGYSWLE